LIKVRHLTKYYGKRLAVDNISFDIGKGEIVGLLGPNAAGKSTTMRILTGFMMPTKGDTWIADCNMVTNSLEGRKHIGYMPESVPLYTDMTVRDYLDFFARLRGVEEIAPENGLTKWLHSAVWKNMSIQSSGNCPGVISKEWDWPRRLFTSRKFDLDEPTVGSIRFRFLKPGI